MAGETGRHTLVRVVCVWVAIKVRCWGKKLPSARGRSAQEAGCSVHCDCRRLAADTITSVRQTITL